MEPGKDKQTRLVGAPDVVKATCPVRGALGGNPLPRDSKGAVLRLHPTQETRPPPTAMPTADAPRTPSKSQRKRDVHALQALGGQLVALSAAQLARLDLPEVLHEAVVAAQRIRAHGARARQMQYIGKVMRQLEPVVLSRILMALTPGRAVTPLPQP